MWQAGAVVTRCSLHVRLVPSEPRMPHSTSGEVAGLSHRSGGIDTRVRHEALQAGLVKAPR
jgi:hypothetical protein